MTIMVIHQGHAETGDWIKVGMGANLQGDGARLISRRESIYYTQCNVRMAPLHPTVNPLETTA
jgi:hypothetical protein